MAYISSMPVKTYGDFFREFLITGHCPATTYLQCFACPVENSCCCAEDPRYPAHLEAVGKWLQIDQWNL